MSDGVVRPDPESEAELAFEGALRYVGNPDLISRSHFARHLVDSGVCKDVPEVFRKYLTEGKPGFVPHRWAALGDAVRWITGAGGVDGIQSPNSNNASRPCSSTLIATASHRWRRCHTLSSGRWCARITSVIAGPR